MSDPVAFGVISKEKSVEEKTFELCVKLQELSYYEN